MKTKFIYRITEENVDGCGGSATVFAEFDAAVSGEIADTLQACLTGQPEDECLDTEDMVALALEQFAAQTGINCRLCDAPYEGEFSFQVV